MNTLATHSPSLMSNHTLVAVACIVIWLTYLLCLPVKLEFLRLINYVFLSTCLLLASLTLVLCSSLVTAYIAIELASLVSIMLIALGVSNKSQAYMYEGAIKYAVITFFGSLAILYGIYGNLSYGASSLNYWTELLVAVGFSIKLGIVPFHSWVTSFNEANEWHNLLLVGTLPKMGIMSFMALNYTGNIALYYLAVGCASLAVGTVLMLNAVNFKSFHAYSAIANLGVMMAIMSCMNSHVYGSMPGWFTFMLLSYNLVFAAIALVCNHCEVTLGLGTSWENSALKYMKFNSYESLVLTACLLSLSAMPPLLSWYAKIVGITYLATAGHWLLVIFILGFSVVSGYCYLRLVAYLWGGYKGRKPLVRVNSITLLRFKTKQWLTHVNVMSMQYPVIAISTLVALIVLTVCSLYVYTPTPEEWEFFSVAECSSSREQTLVNQHREKNCVTADQVLEVWNQLSRYFAYCNALEEGLLSPEEIAQGSWDCELCGCSMNNPAGHLFTHLAMKLCTTHPVSYSYGELYEQFLTFIEEMGTREK